MDRPNFLIIMSDQHHPRRMAHAGENRIRTPNLDRLAATGVSFPHAYCAAPLCVPSRSAFLTSRYPVDTGGCDNRSVLASEVPTFAHHLSRAGWETILCGRMHFNGPDQQHGFERRLVGDVSGAMSGPASGLFEGVWAEAGCGQDHASLLDAAAGPGQATYAAYDAAVTARACELLRDRSRQRESCEPYCLVVGLLLPHNPYVCPKELLDEYMDTLPAPESAEHVPAAEHPAVRRLRRFRGADRITPEQARLARAAYFGLITLMDQNIGRILDTLVARGQADNTIVMYTSDHGEMAGDHGLWWKDSFYEGSVGVPMIWSWPRHFGAGRRVDAVVSLLDVGPTLTDLAGAAPLPGARGHSLMPLLAPGGRAEEWPDTAFAETCAVGQRPARMIRAGRWKLNVYDGYEQPQLFDMNADPEEMNDLGADPACAAVRRELMARVMDGWSPARVEALVKDALDAWPPREPERFTPGVSECWRMPAGSNFRV